MSRINFFIIFLVGLSLPIYVFSKIVLVNFDYSSLGDPVSGVKINLKKINNQDSIVFPEEEKYIFDKVTLEINFNKDVDIKDVSEIKAYKNFLTTFYPLNSKTLKAGELKSLLFHGNTTNVPIGSLFSNGDSVEIMLPNNTYSSIFSPELFEKMNYKWENVINKEVGFTGNLKEREVFSYSDAHPNGTFLEVDNSYYLVWNEELFLLEKEIDLKDFSATSLIKISSLEQKPFGICKPILMQNKIICNFQEEKSSFDSDYVFTSTGLKNEDIKEVKLNFSTNLSWKSFENNFLVSIENIKFKLIKKYRGYIPFI